MARAPGADYLNMKFHPVSEIFPLIEGEEFDRLVEDIRTNGLRESIWLHPDGSIIDGRNRYRACIKAKIEPKTRTWNGKGSLVEFVISMNLHRRHLTSSQRACVATDVLPMLEEEARLRQIAQLKQGDKTPVVAKIPPREKGKSRDKAATATSVSPRYVSDAKKLKEEQPEIYAEVRAGKKTIPEAKAAVKQAKKAAVVEQIAKEPEPPPTGPFRVIVIDPPWKYGSRAEDTTHRARNPYPDMEIEAIKALPVSALAHEDCVLWLWTTNAFLREAFECLDAWGFENKTVLTWVKDRMGLGNWLRGQTEHCLMAVKGNPTVTLTNQTTALCAPMREHSRKPDEFYTLVESLCPGSKLEMFARQEREGWACWGAEKQLFAAA